MALEPRMRYDWGRIFGIALRHRREILLAQVIAVSGVLANVPIPLLMPLLVDEVLLDKPAFLVDAMQAVFPAAWHGPVLYISTLLVLTISLRLLALFFNVWQMREFTCISKDVVFRIRCDLLAHLERVSMAEYETLGRGRVNSHLVTDLDTLDEFVGSGISKLFVASFSMIGIGVVLFWLHWQLALVMMVLNPLVIHLTMLLGRRVKRLKSRENQAYAEFQQNLGETLESIQQIRAYNREAHYLGEIAVNNARALKDRSIAYTWKTDAAGRLSFNVFLFGFDSFRALGMSMVLFSDLSIGEMLAVFGYLWFMLEPMREILNLQYNYAAANAALQRINSLFALRAEPLYPHRANPFAGKRTVSVRVENIRFAYAMLERTVMPASEEALPGIAPVFGSGEEEPRESPWILDGVSLHVEAGEKIALVGASGGGKTTLVQMILGLYVPQQGQIYFDEAPVTDIGLDVVRENVVTVLQHPALFNDTVRRNLNLGRAIPDAELWRALEIAQLQDTVAALDNGLDTLLGHHGVRLSGGQRQRLAVARMILADPKVVILDEATSALDTATESRLHQALDEFLRNRTTLIIAHRLSAVKQADRVYVFEQGRIIEEGRHHRLLQRNGMYAQLYGGQAG